MVQSSRDFIRVARHQFVVTNHRGDVVPFANVEVRSETSGSLIQCYSDPLGRNPKGNPFKTDASGSADFHCVGGFYRIRAFQGAEESIRRYVGIGLAQGSDVESEGIIQRYHTAAGTVTVGVEDVDIIVIRKDVGEPTPVELPDPYDATRKVKIVDGKYDALTNPITITSLGTAKTIMGGADYVIDSNGGSIELTPLADGTGWI